jgi:hypothetical protein
MLDLMLWFLQFCFYFLLFGFLAVVISIAPLVLLMYIIKLKDEVFK